VVDTIKIRPFAERDLPAVIEILKHALGETTNLRRTPEWFAWKHVQNPFGPSIILVAEIDGQIAGLRALLRWELVTPDGQVWRCARPVDTATSPAFLRRGVFRALTMEAVEVARAEGLDMLFNTPNSKSGAGYLTLGWQRVGSIGVMIRPKIRLIGRRFEGPSPFSPELITSGALPVDLDVIVDRSPRGLRTPRRPAYLAWRFLKNPAAKYFQISTGEGTAVVRPNYRSGRAELIIADLFGADASRAARVAVRSARASYVASWFSKGSPERAALRRAGFLSVPGLKALTLVARPLGMRELPRFEAWDLAPSDLELL
jgi:GNAT superfamily N-acetyltransferase